MKTIQVEDITKNIREMCIEANHFLTEDMKAAMEQACKEEKSPVGQQVLSQLEDNLQIAGQDMIPICQDTGMAVIFMEIGQDVHLTGGSFEDAVTEGVRRGYIDGYLRLSVVGDPLRLGGRHDAELLTGGTDQTDLAVSNVLIELMHILANTEAPPLNDLTKQKRAQPCRTRTTNAKRPRAFSIIDLLAFAKGENGCCRSSLFCVGMIPPPPPFVNDNLRKNAVKKKFFHFSAALRIFARRV